MYPGDQVIFMCTVSSFISQCMEQNQYQNYMSIDTSSLHVAHYFRFNTVLIYTCRYRTDSHMEEAKNINDSIILRKLPKSVYSCTCASDRRLKLTEVIKACDHFICYYFVCPFPSYRMGIGKIMMYCMYMVI